MEKKGFKLTRNNEKKSRETPSAVAVWVSSALLHSVGRCFRYVQFEFNDKLLYTIKNDPERRTVCKPIFLKIFYSL